MVGKEAIFQEKHMIQVKQFASEHESCVTAISQGLGQYEGRISKKNLAEYIGAAYDRGVLDAIGKCIEQLRTHGEYQAIHAIQKLVRDE